MTKTTDRKSNPLAPPQKAPVSRQGQTAQVGAGSEALASFLTPSDIRMPSDPFAGDDAE